MLACLDWVGGSPPGAKRNALEWFPESECRNSRKHPECCSSSFCAEVLKGAPKKKDYGCYYSPMSELSVSMGNSDSTCGSGGGAERRRNRTDTRPPGNREARVQSSSLSHWSSQPEGTLAAGGGVGKRGPSPRSGAGALEGATTRSSSAAPPRGENARCAGVARPPGTVSASAWPLPSHTPSFGSGPPAYLCV